LSCRFGVRLCLAGALVYAAGCGSQSGEPAATPSPAASASPASATASTPPIQVNAKRLGSKYIFLTKQKGNRIVYVLRADSESGQYFGQDTGRSNFVNPHVTFYGDHGRRLMAIAPAGTVVEKDKTVLMSGGVHARTQNGMLLTSDTLRYDDPDQVVHGVGNVDVRDPQGEELRGSVLDWNLRTGHVNVSGGAP